LPKLEFGPYYCEMNKLLAHKQQIQSPLRHPRLYKVDIVQPVPSTLHWNKVIGYLYLPVMRCLNFPTLKVFTGWRFKSRSSGLWCHVVLQ